MYNSTIAMHYTAYRPPLHVVVLEKALSQPRNRQAGLDLGCGTGQSAHALSNFCDHVVALDPSKSMLINASEHTKITYLNATAEKIPFADKTFDVVTMAGSLNYIEQRLLIDELVRICRVNSEIVVYDFEILLHDFETYLGIRSVDSKLEYDHSSNLTGFSELKTLAVVTEQLPLNANALEIAHLLLSDFNRHDALSQKYNNANPLESVENDIKAMGAPVDIMVNIFYSLYSIW